MEQTRLQAGASRAESDALTPEQVAAYLSDNPDFLQRYPDLLDSLSPPDRTLGGTVVDIQRMMVDKLRGEVDSLRDCAQSLIETSRDNLKYQSRTHAAVVALLDADGLAEGVRLVRDDLPAMLNLDAGAIVFERSDPAWPELTDAGIRILPMGAVDYVLGENREARLVAETIDDGTIFGDQAENVHSCALVRLHVRDRAGRPLPPGMLALGSSEPGTFQPGQGIELITFMARALEKCAARWTAAA